MRVHVTIRRLRFKQNSKPLARSDLITTPDGVHGMTHWEKYEIGNGRPGGQRFGREGRPDRDRDQIIDRDSTTCAVVDGLELLSTLFGFKRYSIGVEPLRAANDDR
jgi:hypothetical protein